MAEPRFVLDHVGIDVADIAASRAFYQQALEPLGFSVVFDIPQAPAVAFGVTGRPQFWIRGRGEPSGPIHICFHATDRERVNRFHEAALTAGGRDNGPPGLREHYHPSYYGAFVLDPDGNNAEAVCHFPPDA
jgi:catechol 2,3-dioxygenase-like lactoylglutathione lyase family enzyme